MLNVGSILGERYQIVRLIGEGGMGSVYEAEHVSLRRKVAIKVLLPEYARNQDSVARFEREALAAGEIGHEGIVEVVDFGVHAGLPYMVMEYLSGVSLADKLDQQRIVSIGEAARIMGQVIAALGAAHAVGIIHRDLKPENVFLIQRNGLQFAKLLDFGISKFMGGEGGMSKSLTKTGALMGTPYYMAPEQALAKRDIDHRADLYSAGVMLYEMATGQLPFLCESQAELLMAIVYQKPPALPPRAIQRDIPEAYADLIVKAMAPKREDRFQDAASFMDALRPFGELEDTRTPSPPVDPRVGATNPEQSPQRPTSMTWEGSMVLDDEIVPSRSFRKLQDRRILAAAVAVVTSVLALGGVWMVSTHEVNESAAASLQTARVAHVDGTPDMSPTVLLQLEGLPPDATVRVDGVVTTLASLHFARGSTHHLEVSAPGRITFETDLLADRDFAQGVTLAPLPAVADPAPSVASVPHTVSEPATVGGVRRGRPHPNERTVPTVVPSVVVVPTQTPSVPGHDPHHDAVAGHVLAPTNEF